MKNWVVIILVMTVAPVLAVTAVTMLTRTVLVVKFEFGSQWVLFSLLLEGVVIHANSCIVVAFRAARVSISSSSSSSRRSTGGGSGGSSDRSSGSASGSGRSGSRST